MDSPLSLVAHVHRRKRPLDLLGSSSCTRLQSGLQLKFLQLGGLSFTKEEQVFVLLDSREVLLIFYCGFVWLPRRPDTFDSVPFSLVLSYCVLEYWRD